jgi:photosynthetic reaction center cytochrome c subunit
MRKILLMVAVATLAALGMFAQDKGGPPKGGKGKGGPPKNLKVLTPENYMDNMRAFVPALGLADKGGCNFCHVADDRSADTKQEKVMARMMIQMVGDINSKFTDGKVHVTCFTCHRGSTEPLTAPPAAN